MPRISMYKPEKGNDYKFIDRHCSEMFQAGGTDVYLHKYIGPKNPSTGTADQPIYNTISPVNIQDLLFLENRDRKYDTEVYRIRGIYNVQNIDFNLSQFGLFIDNDTLYMTVHINDFIKYIGRKPLSGDVMELPHLRDEFALNDADISLPRYYVIEDVGRASEGFSSTWYPHLYRLKLKKITANQQFHDVLNVPTGADADKFAGEYNSAVDYYAGQIVRYQGMLYNVSIDTIGNSPPNTTYFNTYAGNTLENILSTRAKELAINDSVLLQAEADAELSGYQTGQFYTLAVDPTTGHSVLNSADMETLSASNASYHASEDNARPVRTGYSGYLVGDGFPVNGYDFGHGIQFPEAPGVDDFFLRTDFMPNRLFRFDKTRWVKVEDAVRMALSNTDTRQTLKSGFINNVSFIYNDAIATDVVSLIAGDTVINTTIDFVIPLYVWIKLETQEIAFTVSEHSGSVVSYMVDGVPKVKINLPNINSVQQVIPYTGDWAINLCNNREEQRQSLSKVLRPRADL